MERVASKDGASMAYEKTGSGPALIVVDGALCHCGFGPSADLGHGRSARRSPCTATTGADGRDANTEPFSVGREVEDLAALVQAAGGSAVLVGLSSGAALALEAAASGLGVEGVGARVRTAVHGRRRGAAAREREPPGEA